MMTDDERDPRPPIVDPSGRPARPPVDRRCPRCGAGPDRRVRSGGFGAVHDVCGQCGHAFDELTIDPPAPRRRWKG